VTSSAATQQPVGLGPYASVLLRDKRVVAGGVGLAVVGVAAEIVASANGWERDLATGLVVGAAGLVAVHHRGRDLVGWLLYGAALAWFAGSLTSASGWLAEVGEQALFGHRGFLLAALVAPLWRAGVSPRQATACMTVAAIVTSGAALISVGEGAGSATALAMVATVTIGASLAGALLGVLVPWRAMWVAASGATVVWCSAASTLRSVEALTPDDRLLVYQAGIAAAAVFMAASRFDRRPVVEQVVEVGRREGLNGALGDPRLRIGFDHGSTFRAADGSDVVASGSQQSTVLDLGDGRGGVRRVLIVHRPGLLDDPRMRADVEAAAGLLADHHRLIDEVEKHAMSVEASRARLLASDQRAIARFAEDLEQRVLVHLDELSEALDATDAIDATAPEAARVRATAAAIRTGLTELSAGYAPVACADLAVAIGAMVESFPISVQLDVDPVPVDETCGRVLYYVAAEALSNVLKHSRATAVNVCLRAGDGCMELRVDDDGTGAVNVRPGGGLAGLADRLSAAGGSLVCGRHSPRGTSIVARVPVPLPD
jgi:signal transduction histidine kinase